MKNTIKYIVLMIALISCGSRSGSNSSSIAGDYKSIATKKLGEDVEYFFNDEKTYVLCTYEVAGSSQQPRNSIYYLVINVNDNSIVLENRVEGGTVSWYNEKMIQEYVAPGIIRKDQTMDDFITLFNVETGKSYPKNMKQTH